MTQNNFMIKILKQTKDSYKMLDILNLTSIDRINLYSNE